MTNEKQNFLEMLEVIRDNFTGLAYEYYVGYNQYINEPMNIYNAYLNFEVKSDIVEDVVYESNVHFSFDANTNILRFDSDLYLGDIIYDFKQFAIEIENPFKDYCENIDTQINKFVNTVIEKGLQDCYYCYLRNDIETQEQIELQEYNKELRQLEYDFRISR